MNSLPVPNLHGEAIDKKRGAEMRKLAFSFADFQFILTIKINLNML